jgi:septal ring factor EnvC (AmiA/AmiB activator)
MDEASNLARLQKRLTDSMTKVSLLERQVANLQSKNAKQKADIARMTKTIDGLMYEKNKLADTVQWMRGEKNA